MADRVRMKALTVFHNPLITAHLAEGERRPDAHTVIDGDEFSTSEDHAIDLERLGFAERTKGVAAPLTEDAAKLVGAQTSADNGAVTANRSTTAPATRPVARA